MSTARIDTLQHVHDALRATLYQTGKYIQRIDPTQPCQSDKALEKLESLVKTFEAQFAPQLAANFEAGAIVDARLFYALTSMIEACRQAKGHQQRIEVWMQLIRDLNEFIAFWLGYMNKVEEKIKVRALSAKIANIRRGWNIGLLPKYVIRRPLAKLYL